jgi:hypothetical protein
LPELCKDCEKRWDERKSAQFRLHAVADLLAVHGLAGEPGHNGLHHLAHVLGARRPGLGDRRRHGRGNLLVRRRGRQVGVEDPDLGLLLVGQVGAPALGELLDRIAPLFYQHRDHLQLLRALERAALLNALVGERRLQHAQRRELRLILRLHRGDDVGAERLF